jgi:hypothetical protein
MKYKEEKMLFIFCRTHEELKSGMKDVLNIGKEAIKTGKFLYERI